MDNAFLAVGALTWTVVLIATVIDRARNLRRAREATNLAEVNRWFATADQLIRDIRYQVADADTVDAFLRDDMAHPWHR